MKRDFIGRMIVSLLLAGGAAVLWYFVDPLLGVLGLLMSLSTVFIEIFSRLKSDV